jgi:Ser/Thr protein kinase RdoA (MazF antagonist)
VLRRFKDGGDAAREAAVMHHARAHGLPVPEVFEVQGDGLVLERHEIPFEGNRLLHLDLHPDNVLLSRRGQSASLSAALDSPKNSASTGAMSSAA